MCSLNGIKILLWITVTVVGLVSFIGIEHMKRIDTETQINTTIEKEVVSQYLASYFIPNIQVRDINCARLINKDEEEMKKAHLFHKKHVKVPLAPSFFINATKMCDKFKRHFHYTVRPLSEEEESFGLAYSLLVYKDIEQVERLLRAIYRPQNYYCIHLDKKSDNEFKMAVKSVAGCFNNVFISSKSVNVRWGHYSTLEPELICMQDLWKFKSWRYFINLTGQEFPLQTNADLVQILKAMDGANLAEGVPNKGKDRFQKAKESPPPAGLHLMKGSVHIAVQRGFVDFVLHNEIALEFREWIKDIEIPDEAFFSSLIHSPELKVPGAYLGFPQSGRVGYKNSTYPFLTRHKIWADYVGNCHGKIDRMICIFGVGDLPDLSNRKELFANKFHLDFEPLAYNCLEELHYNKTRDSVLGVRKFDTGFYTHLDVVKNHVE